MSTPGMAGVVLENVSRIYPGNVAAVNGVTLEVQDRELLVLVGPSGCGKTTTLRMIAGLEEISSGKITIGDRVVNDIPPKARDIAMVFQNYALYPHMTVYRNLAFGLELRENRGVWGGGILGWLGRWALPKERQAALAGRRFSIAERVHQTARSLGIEELLERFPRQLSGGERQRVALGRAIVRNPAVFLFDEPMSNLDAKLRVEMRRELKQLHQRLQATMVYVTHDQVEALTLGDRIVVMNAGVIQQVGRPIEVYDWPINRFVAGFIGTPAMNFIDGELVRSGEGWAFRRGAWTLPLAGRTIDVGGTDARAAVLGVRPEDVRIDDGRSDAAGALTATVSLVDMLGDATVLTLKVDENAETSQYDNQELYVTSKCEARSEGRPGERVKLSVDSGRVHVFDPHTGENWVRP